MIKDLGFSYLVVFDTDFKKWCKDYDLNSFYGECSKCNKSLLVNIPFISKNRRGLKADICDCGNREVPFSYIDLNYDEVNLNSLG